MVVGLLIETVKELSTHTKLLNKVNFRVTLVNFFETNNVGMIKLAHNKDLLSKLLKPLCRIDQTKVETFHCILVASRLVTDETDKARDSRPKNRSRVNAIIYFLDRFTKWNLAQKARRLANAGHETVA